MSHTMTVTEAAAYLQRSPRSLYRWMGVGRLTYCQDGSGRRAIDRDSVIALSQSLPRQPAHHDRELAVIQASLERLEQRLDKQLVLMEALISLIPVASLEALQRKQDIRDRLWSRS